MPDEDEPKATFYNANMKANQVIQGAGTQYIGGSTFGASSEDLTKALTEMMSLVEKRSPEDQRVLKPMVEDVEAKASKIEQGDTSEEAQSALERGLRSLVAMAPDIADVFVATFANPIGGIALTFKKIADRARGVLPQGGAS
jgi:hypothetical protein